MERCINTEALGAYMEANEKEEKAFEAMLEELNEEASGKIMEAMAIFHKITADAGIDYLFSDWINEEVL